MSQTNGSNRKLGKYPPDTAGNRDRRGPAKCLINKMRDPNSRCDGITAHKKLDTESGMKQKRFGVRLNETISETIKNIDTDQKQYLVRSENGNDVVANMLCQPAAPAAHARFEARINMD